MPDGRISQAGGRRMAIDESMKPQWERERKERGRDLEQAQTLQSGGGGGTYDGMEARVAKLESGVDEIKKSLTDIRVTLASIDERTKQMATKWDVVLILGAMAALIGGVVALAALFLPLPPFHSTAEKKTQPEENP